MEVNWRRKFMASIGSTLVLLLVLVMILAGQKGKLELGSSNNESTSAAPAASQPDYTVTYKESESVPEQAKEAKTFLDKTDNKTKAPILIPPVRPTDEKPTVTSPSENNQKAIKPSVEKFPPEVLSTNPGNGAINVLVNTNIGVTFNEELKSSTVNESTVILKDSMGKQVGVKIIYHYKTIVLTPNSNLQFNTIYSVILGSQIQDLVGNGLASDYTFSFHTITDKIAPQIVSVSPKDKSINNPVGQKIKAIYNEALDPTSVNDQTVQIKDSIGRLVNIEISNSGKEIIITPSQLLNYRSEYRLNLSKEIKDLAGNKVGKDFQASFRTIDFPVVDGLISNFETGTLEGWGEDAVLYEGGKQSKYAMKLINKPQSGVERRKYFTTPVLKGYDSLEFDIDLGGGKLLAGDASAVGFEQAGWKWVSLSDYAKSGVSGWQHVTIPLSDFPSLNKKYGTAFMVFRFWGLGQTTFLIDNIRLTVKEKVTLPNAPTNFQGQVISPTEIKLTWEGNSANYKVYKDGLIIGQTGEKYYSIQNLIADTEYQFLVTSTDGTNESAPTETLKIKTLPAKNEANGFLISDFESGVDNWDNDAVLAEGKNSSGALRLVNPINGAVETRREFNSELAKDYSNMEFDINLHGTNILSGDAAVLVFEQAGWKTAELANYVTNGLDGWQHVKIPFSEITNFNPSEGIAHILFRFWNFASGTYDIDNILLS